jgi:hypothetical protein
MLKIMKGSACMINKKALSHDIKYFCSVITSEFGEDSWELHYAEEYLDFLEEAFCDPDADDDIKIIIQKFNNLLTWIKEKLSAEKFNELQEQACNIYKLIDYLNEYEGINWR